MAATITTDADLYRFWAALMGPLGFSTRSLWLAVFDENHRPIPVLNPVEGIPVEPTSFLAGWVAFARTVTEASRAHSAAVLYSRPGTGPMTARDRRWARGIHDVYDGPVWLRPTHFANDERLLVFAPDDLLG
jgi:hypothetical protein